MKKFVVFSIRLVSPDTHVTNLIVKTSFSTICNAWLVLFFSAKIGKMEDLEDIRREEEELRIKAERRKMREKELKQMKKKRR